MAISMNSMLSMQKLIDKVQQLEQQVLALQTEKKALNVVYNDDNDILLSIIDGAPLNTIFEAMVNHIKHSFPTYQACIMLYDKDSNEWHIETGTGIEHDLASSDGCIKQLLMETFTRHLEQNDTLLHISNAIKDDAWQNVLNRHNVDTCIAQPFTLKKQNLYGYISIFFMHSSTDEISTIPALLVYLTHRLTLALQHKSIQDSLLISTRYDAITGMYNIQSFKNNFAVMLKNAKHHFERLSLFVVEVKMEKIKIEDLDTNNIIIKNIAKRLHSCIRSSDLLASFSDTEFVIALRIKNLPDVEIVAQRIMQSMQEPIRLRGHTFLIKLTIGISSHPEHASFTELYNAATKAQENTNSKHLYCIEYYGRFCHSSAELYDF